MEGDRLVVMLISGRKDQRHGAVLLLELLELACQPNFFLQLFAVASLEFLPTFRVVPKPLSERIRRRNFFHPEVDSCFLLGNAARPDPVH